MKERVNKKVSAKDGTHIYQSLLVSYNREFDINSLRRLRLTKILAAFDTSFSVTFLGADLGLILGCCKIYKKKKK